MVLIFPSECLVLQARLQNLAEKLREIWARNQMYKAYSANYIIKDQFWVTQTCTELNFLYKIYVIFPVSPCL